VIGAIEDQGDQQQWGSLALLIRLIADGKKLFLWREVGKMFITLFFLEIGNWKQFCHFYFID